MFGKNPYEGIPFGKKKPEVPEAVEPRSEVAVADESELAKIFDAIKDQGLKGSINDHAIAVISGKAQDSVLRSQLEKWAKNEGIDAETLSKLIELQKNRLNQE